MVEYILKFLGSTRDITYVLMPIGALMLTVAHRKLRTGSTLTLCTGVWISTISIMFTSFFMESFWLALYGEEAWPRIVKLFYGTDIVGGYIIYAGFIWFGYEVYSGKIYTESNKSLKPTPKSGAV